MGLTLWRDSLGELVLEEVGVRNVVLDPKVKDPLRLPAPRVLASTRFQWVQEELHVWNGRMPRWNCGSHERQVRRERKAFHRTLDGFYLHYV